MKRLTTRNGGFVYVNPEHITRVEFWGFWCGRGMYAYHLQGIPNPVVAREAPTWIIATYGTLPLRWDLSLTVAGVPND